jgi:predicted dehydrogenase
MQRYLTEGYVGELYHMDIWWGMTLQFDARPDAGSWRFRPETGGGTVYELIHVFDIALFLGGPVKRLVAMLSTSEKKRPFHDKPKGMPVRVPDSSAFLLEFESGATAVIHTSFVTRGTEPDGTTTVRVEVSGSKGRIVTDGLYGLRGVSGKQGPLAPIDPREPYPQPYEQFVRAILGGEPVKTGFEAGLEAAKLVDAAYASAKTNAWVSL